MLRTEGLGYWYRDKAPLFQDINLEFEEGQSYAILATVGPEDHLPLVDCRAG